MDKCGGNNKNGKKWVKIKVLSGYCQQGVVTMSLLIFSRECFDFLEGVRSQVMTGMKRLRRSSERGGIWASISIVRAFKSLIFIFLPLFIQMLMYFLCRTWAKLLGTFRCLKMPKIYWHTPTIYATFSITLRILTFFSSSFSSLYVSFRKTHSFSSGNLIFCSHESPWTDLLLLRSLRLSLSFSYFFKKSNFN